MTEPSRGFRERPVSFVRRSGRMSEAQERAWRELSPRFVVPVARELESLAVSHYLPWRRVRVYK